MLAAKIPNNEYGRLQKLKGYQVLDTSAEKEYDDITKLASFICETPIALISLVDKDRQWFKSKVGLNPPELARDIAFCAHTILTDDVLIVSDSSKDQRFYDNPLTTNSPHIQFYAGAPLITPDGWKIGTLCVIDRKPRELSKEQLSALKTLSQNVVTLLELRLNRQKVKDLERAINEHSIVSVTNEIGKISFVNDKFCEISKY
ncbi:MAG: GAF domain-containing protein [Leptospiraceae bacterium]|nr:GAF domain-containing protein [Leptospiraceae bacterium]